MGSRATWPEELWVLELPVWDELTLTVIESPSLSNTDVLNFVPYVMQFNIYHLGGY